MPDGKKKQGRDAASKQSSSQSRKGGVMDRKHEPQHALHKGPPPAEHFGEAALREAMAEFGIAPPPGGNGAQTAGASSSHASARDAAGAQQATSAHKEPPPKTMAQIMGEIVWLMTQSPRHKSIPLGDLEWLVMPAILLKQFRMFYSGERPVGVALWALVDDAVAKRMDAGDKRLAAAEWKCGTNQRVVDVIAPFGGEAEMRGQVESPPQ